MNRASRSADAVAVAGGGALLGSAFAHWVRRGPGHSLRGHELVDAIVGLGDTLPGLTGARLTVLWYLVPASGALTWIVIALTGAASRTARVFAVVTVVVTAATVAAFVRMTSVSSLGAGAWLALGGAALVAIATFALARESSDA
ncbi:MAG TPA: hypothetical protein VFZ83_10150 [Acidimicrobiia bacterium]|nr:hypothetical protein [Acidimicrobiia bacterium]